MSYRQIVLRANPFSPSPKHPSYDEVNEALNVKEISSLVVTWPRFGPYHVARLEAVGRLLMTRGVRVLGVEVARTDSTYAWNVTESSKFFERFTLFPNENYHSLRPGTIATGIRACLERLGPEAVAIDGWSIPGARAALRWCRQQGRIAIAMSESFADGRRRPWWKEFVKSRIVRRFDASLVGGRPHAQYIAGLGMSEERIFLGYDTIDNDHFADGAKYARDESERLRRKYRLPKKYFYANTRFLPRKNLDGLLHAYSAYRLRVGGHAWGLVITGSGQCDRELRRLANELYLHDVVWPGFVQYEELPVYYGLASAFIHPAKSEAWGLVVNEAMASGLPVLVSKKVGSRFNLVQAGENGFLFDPYQVEEIAITLSRLASLSDLERQSMSQRSQEIISAWGPERFAEGLWQAICSAAAARSNGRSDR